MAIIKASFMSEVLERQVGFTAIVPADSVRMAGPGSENAKNDEPMPAVYLLSGYSGSGFFWVYNYPVASLSSMNRVAIIMPDPENHFYTDDDMFGYGWGKFIGTELVDFTRKMFNLSHKREDTTIAGFSMGGFGALLNGCTYRETFGHIVAVSGALLTEGVNQGPGGSDNPFFRGIFGDPAKVAGSHHDPRAAAAEAVKSGNAPSLYMAVGYSDFLRQLNLSMVEYIKGLNYPNFTFEEGEGGHDNKFCEDHVFRGIRLALGKEQ